MGFCRKKISDSVKWKGKKKKSLPFYVSNYMKRCYPNVSAIVFFSSFPWCLSRVLCFACFYMDVLFYFLALYLWSVWFERFFQPRSLSVPSIPLPSFFSLLCALAFHYNNLSYLRGLTNHFTAPSYITFLRWHGNLEFAVVTGFEFILFLVTVFWIMTLINLRGGQNFL